MKLSKKTRKRIILGISAFFLLLFSCATITMVWYQDVIVQKIVTGFNKDFNGALIIEDTNIEPLANFPYISLAIKNVQVFEDKEDMFAPILDVSDISLGVNFWSLLAGDFEVNMLKVENGNFDIYRYTDGSFNLINALSGKARIKELKEDYNIELKKIELANLDIIKYDEASNIHVETYIENATSRFRNWGESLMIALESQLILNVINDGDSTIFTNKRFDAVTELDYDRKSGILVIQPTVITMQNANFNVEGQIDILNEFDVDIEIHGNNPNFNLLIALAPKELIPTLEQYENAGKIHFEATIEGKTLSGEQPAINAVFGCDSAYFKNPASQKQLEEISFSGHFTNGMARDYSTMEFSLDNVKARPEAGIFIADLKVKNFDAPEIDLTVTSDFDLDFLAKFLNITSLQNLDGDVSLRMKFNDIIDIQNPEKSVEEFNKSYFSELNVNNLTFNLPDYPLKFDSIDIKATMDGNHANIEYFFLNVGGSDVTIRGEIDDLPAIIHQTSDSIQASLFIYSSLLDIKELTSFGDTLEKKPVDEKIENLRLDLAFKTTPKLLINSANLPVGDFFINNLYGKLEHYPHTFKNINAHILIDDENMEIRELIGKIDKSDFTYSGYLDNYPVLMAERPEGSIDIDFSFNSDLVRLNDLFTYNGKNYVPEDYRNEEITGLKMYGNAELTFNDSLVNTKIFFDQLNADLTVHSMDIRDIHGKFRFFEDYIILDAMTGSIGNTAFSTSMNLYVGDSDSTRKASNQVVLQADLVDFDQLSNYATKYPEDGSYTVNHDSVFNIYTLPFTDLEFAVDIKQLHYHKHLVENINADLRMQKDHFLFVDTLQFQLSGGRFNITGYFNGSDPEDIYFFPDVSVSQVNLEDVLYRFDNFGQDYIISENLAGVFSGKINGKVNMHADMVPQINGSEIYLDFEIINGSLKNYKPLNSLSEYFKNKNLAHIRFDTLSNKLEIANGVITIPNMTINSSLGFMDISGTQDFDNHMEYYFKVPLKLVTSAAWQKLFGKKKTIADSTHIDAIQYQNNDRKLWYVNLKLEGKPDAFNVSLGKRQKEKG
jgi:hypothetical protein